MLCVLCVVCCVLCACACCKGVKQVIIKRAFCGLHTPNKQKSWSFWRHFAAYFPARIVKTADLPADGRYIFVAHPHGVATLYAWPVFDTTALNFSTLFPGLDVFPMTLEFNFRVPLMREWLLLPDQDYRQLLASDELRIKVKSAHQDQKP